MTDIATPGLRLAHRLSQLTFGATLLLILAGGLVTNTGAALAVPDWPTTFGYNMFLYPWAQMVGGVFFEHSHRLLGSVVGMLTLALAASLWPAGGRWRVLGLVATAAVITQGVLGGLRVVLLQPTLAILHGCLAQAFLALVVVIMLLTAPRPASASARDVDPTLRTLAFLAVALVYLQLVFGAFLTHAGWIELHLVTALAVYVLVPVVAARVARWGGGRAVSGLLHAMLGVQLALGIASFLVRFTSIGMPGGTTTSLAMPVAHRVVGSIILAATIALAVRTATANRGRAGAVGRPIVSQAAS
ncbi:MAG: COX15/CtaA family protein [Candidatus Rokubacteria bacterium]|nr:COX15/CtaA family protein [Candidatus Rokubacteria bacterium]